MRSYYGNGFHSKSTFNLKPIALIKRFSCTLSFAFYFISYKEAQYFLVVICTIFYITFSAHVVVRRFFSIHFCFITVKSAIFCSHCMCPEFKSIRKIAGNVKIKANFTSKLYLKKHIFSVRAFESTLGNIHFGVNAMTIECNLWCYRPFFSVCCWFMLLFLFSSFFAFELPPQFYRIHRHFICMKRTKNGASCWELPNKHLSKFIIWTLFVCTVPIIK